MRYDDKPNTLAEQLEVLQQQLTALAGMHDQLERRVEALEATQTGSSEAVDQGDMEHLQTSIFNAVEGSKQMPDGMISRDV